MEQNRCCTVKATGVSADSGQLAIISLFCVDSTNSATVVIITTAVLVALSTHSKLTIASCPV